MTRIDHLVVAGLMRFWLATSSNSWRRLPRPVDEPHVHAPGDDPDRVLVAGNGIAMSYGVLSHQIGFGGHLARQLTDRTGRGSDVELMVGADLDAGAVLRAIVGARPARFDAIVLTLGGAEGVRLVSAAQWRRDVDALLDTIAEHAPTTETFLVGVPALGRIVRMPAFATTTIQRLVSEITEHARGACSGRERVTYIAFEPRGTDLVRTRNRSTYEEWGSLIAAGVAERLGANADRARAIESIDERERVGALDSLGILGAPEDARFEQITETAQALFGVSSASLTFLDDERQWVKAFSGGVAEEVSRADAFCDVTIQRPGIFVVNDALAHPQFRDLPMVREGRVRFYAGYPVEAPNGMRVGALCLMDPAPRAFSRADEALLRELAMRAQTVLRQSAVA